MAEKKATVRRRRTPRVTGDGKGSTVTKTAEHRGDKAEIRPLAEGEYEIICQASELVPVAQYANVTIGPLSVRRVVTSVSNTADLKKAIQEIQEVIYDVIAEDREAVEESVRLHNQREAEEAKKDAKRR